MKTFNEFNEQSQNKQRTPPSFIIRQKKHDQYTTINQTTHGNVDRVASLHKKLENAARRIK